MDGIPELLGAAGPPGHRWVPSGASTVLGTPEAKTNARTWLLPWIGCWMSVHCPPHPVFNCLLTHLFGIFQLLSVHPLASDSLYLDKEERFLGVCKGQRESMALQGLKGGLGEGKGRRLSTEEEPNSEAVPQGARTGRSLSSALGIFRDPWRFWEHEVWRA